MTGRIAHIIIYIVMLIVPARTMAIEQKLSSAISDKSKGDACYGAGRFSEALEFYTKALDGAKNDGNEHLYYACLGNIGNIYAGMGDVKRALHYYALGYEAAQKAKDVETQWGFVTNIVAAYCQISDEANAQAFFRLQMQLPIKDVVRQKYYSYNNQAYIALAGRKLDLAEYYFKTTEHFVKERRMPMQYVVGPLLELGKIRRSLHDSKGALEYYSMARDSANAMQTKEQLVNIYREMSEVYKQEGQRDSAERYRSMYLALSDSIFNVGQFNMANSKLFEYENNENQKRIDILVSQNSTQLIVIVVFLVFAVTVTFLYVALRKKTRNLLDAQRLLVSKNEELMASERNSQKLLKQYVKALNDNGQTSSNAENEAADSCLTPQTTKDESSERSDIGLDEEQRNRLLNSIATVMDDVELISSSDFNLPMLADKVGSNTRYVSWVINETYGKNFKTLLNEYRIREACKRLADKEHYGNVTIQAIYEDLGYNSAASFIQAFKKVNGVTPSVYQKLRNNG